MRSLLVLLSVCMPLISSAQQKGIKWVKGLTWEQVKQKASNDQKYIFLDCYTTWCGPCKAMDKNVYGNDTVGRYFNKYFISVKVQMDKTKNDKRHIQRWYAAATAIQKRYKIAAFPTYIFLSPDGVIVLKETGYKPVGELVKIADLAMQPGRIYNDPFAEYDSLISEYKKGNKAYDKIPYMINQANKANDLKMAEELTNEYTNYLKGRKTEELYTKENISFISSIVTGNSKFLSLFYPDGRKIDEIMGRPGYAKSVVDRVIMREIVRPSGIKEFPQGIVWDGGKIDSSEANWENLYGIIKARYNIDYAERNLLTAKIYWYLEHNNFPSAAKYYFEKLNKYGIDTLEKFPGTSDIAEYVTVNSYAWQIFLWIHDKALINEAIKWMQEVIKDDVTGGYIDTYANLLYKIGRKEEAVEWQQKAVQAAKKFNYKPDIEELSQRLDKMRRNEPTWDLH